MPGPMANTQMSRRPYGNASVSQAHRDITDDRYKELRRPRKVVFYCNGNRYFKGKKLYITPHRYLSFNDLLNDLTGKLPSNVSLPYGVRQIYTPLGGRKIRDIEELKDGSSYVCAGFETFRSMKYSNEEQMPWAAGRPHNHDVLPPLGQGDYSPRNGFNSFYNRGGFHPGKHLRHSYPHRHDQGAPASQRGSNYLIQSDSTSMKPKVITVVRNGSKPRTNIKILLNRRSLQSYEQLMSDVTESFGPKWKNDRVRKLYTISGREVNSISDFFRNDDVFIAVGNENITAGDVQSILEELYPDNPYAQNLLKEWDKNKKKKLPNIRYTQGDDDKRDSGYSEESHLNQRGEPALTPRPDYRYDPNARERELKTRLDRERERAAYDERDRARKRMKKKMESEKRALDEERRKRGLLPKSEPKDPFKKMDEEKERERRELEEQRRLAEKQRRQEEEEQARFAKDNEPENTADRLSPRKLPAEKSKTRENSLDKGAKDQNNKDPGKTADDENNNNVPTNKKTNVENSKLDDAQLKPKAKSRSNLKKSTKVTRPIINSNQIIDKYEVGKTLGDGNFAIVKQSRLKSTGADYAMKIIDKSKLKGKEHMIENEIAIMKACNHSNIVKLVEEYETTEEIYLIMELIKGGDLFDAITQSVKFGEQQAASMAGDLTNALFYLHSRHIVHRDLKPENLMVCRNKDGSITLKLADFGLAMEVKNLIFTVCGTPTYVAPEILTETGYGLEVDMWAVGVITYILLCGFPPFRSPDRKQTELFEYIKAGEYGFLSPYWDSISDSAKDLISNLLIVDKAKRFSAIDVLCHPWIITYGGMMELPDNLEEHRKNRRKELEAQAKINLENWRTNRT